MPKHYAKFDHMVWPIPDIHFIAETRQSPDDLSDKVDAKHLKRLREMAAAYYSLVTGSRRYRENVVRKVRGEMPHHTFR